MNFIVFPVIDKRKLITFINIENLELSDSGKKKRN